MTATHTAAGIVERAGVLAGPLPEPRNLAANVAGFRDAARDRERVRASVGAPSEPSMLRRKLGDADGTTSSGWSRRDCNYESIRDWGQVVSSAIRPPDGV